MIHLGILRAKTMEDKLIYIPNDDKKYPFCTLKLLVEKVGIVISRIVL